MRGLSERGECGECEGSARGLSLTLPSPPHTAASSTVSAVLSATLALLIAAVTQVFKSTLVSSELGTILGGFLASLVSVFVLTAISNLEQSLFRDSYQARFFPEGEAWVCV